MRNITVPIFLSLGIFFGAAVALSANASEEKTVTWQIIHWPPFMKISGDVVEGQFNELLNILETGLPSYRHKRSQMFWSRVWHLIENGSHVCNIFAFKNPAREKFAVFSEPFSMFLSNRIIMRRDTVERLKIDIAKPYSIAKLVKFEGIKGLLEKSRSYSAKIDELLAAHASGSNFSRRPIRSEGLIRVLLGGRVDYIVEYPAVASFYRDKLQRSEEELVALQIEDIDPLTPGYIACPRNAWGKSLIRDLNALVRSEKPTRRFRRIIEMAASTSEDIDLIRDKYPDFIKGLP